MTRHPRSPVDEDLRARIEAELLSPQNPPRSRAALARDAGVSPRTINRWARDLGVDSTTVFDTSSIARATQSATDRRRADRSDLADELQRRARTLLADLDGPFLVFAFGGKDNVYSCETLPKPPTADVRNIVQSADRLLGRAQDIDQRDAQPDDHNADEVLAKLFDGLAGAYQAITGRPATPAGSERAEETP